MIEIRISCTFYDCIKSCIAGVSIYSLSLSFHLFTISLSSYICGCVIWLRDIRYTSSFSQRDVYLCFGWMVAWLDVIPQMGILNRGS